MAVVRGVALKLQAGSGQCQVYEMAWDEDGGLQDTGREVSVCGQPPVINVLGSGICEAHAPLFLPAEGGWSNN